MVSRQAAAVLQGVGCEQWICSNKAEMVEQALSLAGDYDQLERKLRLSNGKSSAK